MEKHELELCHSSTFYLLPASLPLPLASNLLPINTHPFLLSTLSQASDRLHCFAGAAPPGLHDLA